MDGAHTHGPSGGAGPDLAIIVLAIGALVLVGPVVVGAAIELFHILVIILATVITIAVVGTAGAIWWKFHTHKIGPPWKRTQIGIKEVRQELPQAGAYLAITEEQLRLAIERAVERSRKNGQ